MGLQRLIGETIVNPVLFVGKTVEFQDEGTRVITEMSDDAIFISSEFFTGWMLKAEYFDLLGVE